MKKFFLLLPLLLLIFSDPSYAAPETPPEEAAQKSVEEKVDAALEPIAKRLEAFIFYSIPVGNDQAAPLVLILLAGTAIFLSIYFKFLNLRSFRLAYRTIKGKYSKPDDPGQITHFQAISTALSATVGLGNIAGVAVAISIGGPGAVLWMVIMGLLGMTSKFTECTLGVKYRKIDSEGKTRGGGMYYLRDGLKERGFGGLGKVLAVIFAVACIGGALGAGNMFQINQATAQVTETFGSFAGDNSKWVFGLITAILVGMVILGGIVCIARVTAILVPLMCLLYLGACIIVLVAHASSVPAAFGTIISEAFQPTAAAGGFIGGLIQGIRRGVFSNEAGVGSSAIAHSAVKTRKPASEGIVALLEPFVDTVVVCTMTALVIVVTGMWQVNGNVKNDGQLFTTETLTTEVTPLTAETKISVIEKDGDSIGNSKWIKVKIFGEDTEGYIPAENVVDRSSFAGGIWMTSQSFQSVISWFPYLLAIAVFLFAFSTMISWSYYGEQAVGFLTSGNSAAIHTYKIFFCLCVVLGSAASLGNVIIISDSLFYAMVVPNLIGLYFLLPVVKKELADYIEHTRAIDDQS